MALAKDNELLQPGNKKYLIYCRAPDERPSVFHEPILHPLAMRWHRDKTTGRSGTLGEK